jgi:hypothetical protein
MSEKILGEGRGIKMISEGDIWHTAQVMLSRYGADATVQAARMADALFDSGEVQARSVWLRIIKAIELLQDNRPPAKGTPIH